MVAQMYKISAFLLVSVLYLEVNLSSQSNNTCPTLQVTPMSKSKLMHCQLLALNDIFLIIIVLCNIIV